MAYDYQDDLPATYPHEEVLLHMSDPQWRISHHQKAEQDPLNQIGHGELYANFAHIFDRRTLHLCDLGVRAYEIATLPEHLGVEDVEPTVLDEFSMQAAIDTTALFRKLEPFDLLEVSDDLAAALLKETPSLAELAAAMAESTRAHSLTALEKRRVWIGTGFIRTLRIFEQADRAA